MQTNKIITIVVTSLIVGTIVVINRKKIRLLCHKTLSRIKTVKDVDFIKDVGKQLLRDKKKPV